MTVEMLRAFFGWCTLINWGMMLLAVILMAMSRGWTYRLHAKINGITEDEVRRNIYLVMIGYKTAIILFCLVPYIVLRIIA
jgi:hypothetical protein